MPRKTKADSASAVVSLLGLFIAVLKPPIETLLGRSDLAAGSHRPESQR
jgi:hypothetical protein